MDQDSELDALLPYRKSVEAMHQARVNASQGVGRAVEATDYNQSVAEALWYNGDSIGYLERSRDGWCVVTGVELVYGEGSVRVELPSAPTAEQAIEEAILTTAGYLWLRALNDRIRVVESDEAITSDEIAF